MKHATMVNAEFDNENQKGQIVLQPNHSWTWRANLYFLATLFVISIAIAIGFLIQGYWVILPFAGLEMLALTAAIYYCVRKTHRQEVLRFSMDEVVIEAGVNKVEEEHRFQRFFTRVHVEAPKGARRTQRIALTERERNVEVGEFLTDDEKKTLIRELRHMIRLLENSAPTETSLR